MIAKYKREFSRYVTVAVTLIAICCATISAQERSSAGNLYVLKDFGEFRLPSSLRPMFDYQVGTFVPIGDCWKTPGGKRNVAMRGWPTSTCTSWCQRKVTGVGLWMSCQGIKSGG